MYLHKQTYKKEGTFKVLQCNKHEQKRKRYTQSFLNNAKTTPIVSFIRLPSTEQEEKKSEEQ
jgi:hypothetical protein